MVSRKLTIAFGYLALTFMGCLNDPPTFLVSFETGTDMRLDQVGRDSPRPDLGIRIEVNTDQGLESTLNAFSDDYTRFGTCRLKVGASEGLLLNDRWANGAIIDRRRLNGVVEIEIVQAPTGGQLQLGPDGGFIYSPTDARMDTDKFSYRLRYDGVAGETANVFIRQPANRIVIDALDDSVDYADHCTLRQAIARTNGLADMGGCLDVDNGPIHIVFATMGSIQLQSSNELNRLTDELAINTIFGQTDAYDLFISRQVHIHGCGRELTILDGGGSQRHFHVGPGAALTLDNMALVNGRAELGGSILNEGQLKTRGVLFSNNQAIGQNGAFAIGAETPTDVLACNIFGSGGGGGGGAGIGGSIAGLRGSQTQVQGSETHPCHFNGNVATGGMGGEIYRVDVSPTTTACGGEGGGLGGGSGGLSHIEHNGASASLMGGGGGGSPNGFYTYSGFGGHGGFGGGGGAGAHLYLLTDGEPGLGGFAAGDGAAPPYGENGGGGGGGAGLGGAIAILGGRLVIDTCSFAGNATRPGLGGQPANVAGLGRGDNGSGKGDDVFTLRAGHAIDTTLIDWVICEDVSEQGGTDCVFRSR